MRQFGSAKARIAGHSSIVISARYVHPSGDAVLRAMERQGRLSGTGDKTGDSGQVALRSTEQERLLTQTNNGSKVVSAEGIESALR